MCLGKNVGNYEVLNFYNLNIKSSKEVKILGKQIDSNLNFYSRIKSICRKAGKKLWAFLRISFKLNTRQKQLLYKSMIKSQFNYCLLVWMFCSRQCNNLISKLHQRSLRVSYKDQKTSYQNLLETHNEITIH